MFLFMYDCARLMLIMAFAKDQIAIPALCANALFPVAGFFLMADSQKYVEYGPLYAAGKALAVFAGVVWLLFSARHDAGFLFSPVMKLNSEAFSLLVLTGADGLSIALRLSMRKKVMFHSTGDIAKCG